MFGRRKDGFVKEEVIDEFSEEYNEDIAREKETQIIDEEKVDLLDLLEEEDEEFGDIEEFIEIVDERTRSELLGDFIRERSLASFLTSRKSLMEDENFEETLEELLIDDSYEDISIIEGKEDLYYYSNKNMSDNYAMIAMLVTEDDLGRIIAEMVRWNAKTYPCATPLYYFRNSPYNYKEKDLDLALEIIMKDPKYEDIGEIITKNNRRYLYSSIHLSEKYARALANSAEQGEGGYYY